MTNTLKQLAREIRENEARRKAEVWRGIKRDLEKNRVRREREWQKRSDELMVIELARINTEETFERWEASEGRDPFSDFYE